MNNPYKIVYQACPADHAVILLLNGKFDEESIPELDQTIRAANNAQPHIVLDLSEVTLVDRKAVRFLSDRASQGVRLVNCPLYLRRWIAQENHDV